ncbi:tyrosine-type recombinase/integrase [Herminiimonas sp. CN]|uniref:tyrosine-type recombinase/integrase n=1 Tax=Herminiimonas sp. CN TaxID=1349818 RepID=UPI000473F9E6|nr:tyrosine-type recombinase/integrase [Herminiimonas sp. CN]
MGRIATRNKNLPAGMRARHRGDKIYYFLDTGAKPRREIPLGQDYVLAVQKWAELTVSGDVAGKIITFRHAAERYQREVMPNKGLETQKDNLRELANLYKFFDVPPVPLDDIEPIHVRQYLDWRKSAPVRANREKALFSHIFNFSREKGLTSKANPCAGIRGFKEAGRNAYIDDEVYQAVWEAAEQHCRDAMDLAYLTGQRPADVRKMSQSDIASGAVSVRQNKGGKLLRVSVEGEFAAVIERINARKVSGFTLAAKDGQKLTKAMLRGAFDRARDIAVEASQIAAECAGLPDITDRIRSFQFRDLRAKAGTDTEELRGMAAAKDQLGHSTETMTAHYVRHRRGKLVKPTK